MLQDLSLPSLSWWQLVFWALAAVFGSGTIATLATLWVTRRNRQSDVHVTEATAAEIKIRARVAEGDAIGRYMSLLVEAQERIDAIRDERDGLQLQVAQLTTEQEMAEMFIARLHAANKLGIQLKDLPPTIAEVINLLQAVTVNRGE